MKLADLKPATVYRVTPDDYTSSSWRYYYAATGDPVERDVTYVRPRHSWKGNPTKVTRVLLHPVATGTERFKSIATDELRRGLSIVDEVCPFAEAATYFAETDATLTAQEAEHDAKTNADEATFAALDAIIGRPVYGGTQSVRVYPTDAARLVAIVEAADAMAHAFENGAPYVVIGTSDARNALDAYQALRKQ